MMENGVAIDSYIARIVLLIVYIITIGNYAPRP